MKRRVTVTVEVKIDPAAIIRSLAFLFFILT